MRDVIIGLLEWLESLPDAWRGPALLGGAVGLLALAIFLFNLLLGWLVVSIRVEGSNLVVRLFHLVPIRHIYLRDIAVARLGAREDWFQPRWSYDIYGLTPFSKVIVSLRENGRRRVILKPPNARRLLADIQAFR